MLEKKEKKLLISSLPEGWKQIAAEEFTKSESYIEKVAYAQIENLTILEWLVSLAEKNVADLEQKKLSLKDRIQNLASI